MLMKKLSEDHYIIMNDSEIKEGDWYLTFQNENIIGEPRKCEDSSYDFTHCKKITHSNIGHLYQDSILPLSLQEVKELIGVVDVEKKALEISPVELDEDEFDVNETHRVTWIDGYNQALEDNKEKKYTEDDLKKAICIAKDSMGVDNDGETCYSHLSTEQIIQSLQPQTEWEVEIVDGKLKLKQ